MIKIIFAALLTFTMTQVGLAKTSVPVEKVIKSSFKGVTSVKTERLILNSSQYSKIVSRAKAAVKTKIYRYYELNSGSKKVGYGILISRKIRTKNATILYVFDLNGKLKFSEIMGFGEPPEFIPNKQWMNLFDNKQSSAKLTMGKDIPTISGSTLSARCVSDSARIARAIYEVVLLKK